MLLSGVRSCSDHARQRFRPLGASWNQEGAFYGQEGRGQVEDNGRRWQHQL